MNKRWFLLTLAVIFVSGQSVAAVPEGWGGYFKGQCELISPKRGSFYNFPMALEVSAVNDKKANWIITYGEGQTQQIRNYTLLDIDANIGHFAIDENNGIVIDQYLVGSEFMSLFEISNVKIQSTYTLDSNGTLDVSMETFTFDPVREKKVGQYTVANYGLSTKQKCRLFKW